MMSRRIKVLFVMPWRSSFVERDLEMLRRHFEVKIVLARGDLQASLSMAAGIAWCDVSFSWFAGRHAFQALKLSKLAGKRSIVVVGGYEVAEASEIQYDSLLTPETAERTRYILNNADKVLAVSEFSKKEILSCSNPRDLELLYNGVDCNGFKAQGEKEDLVITVGNSTRDSCRLKGIDTFVRASMLLPRLRFAVIGKFDEDIRRDLEKISPSVEFIGPLPPDELVSWMRKAKVYCQLSYRESFGMALAEAMCCECVPVVTGNGALPEVVGDTGFYVPYGDPTATAKAEKEALKAEKGKAAHLRIKNRFSLERRERRLATIIRGLVEDRN